MKATEPLIKITERYESKEIDRESDKSEDFSHVITNEQDDDEELNEENYQNFSPFFDETPV